MSEFELEDLDLNPVKEYVPPEKQTLETLDLAQELYKQFLDANDFLKIIYDNENIPPNQIIAVVNSIRSFLTDMTKLRTDLYNAERLKALEAATIAAMKNAPPDVQERFFREYRTSIDMMKAKK